MIGESPRQRASPSGQPSLRSEFEEQLSVEPNLRTAWLYAWGLLASPTSVS